MYHEEVESKDTKLISLFKCSHPVVFHYLNK